MPNKFYQPGEQRAARVNDLFAAIAPRYDLINDLQSFWLHRWWKRTLVKMASVKSGDRALDLCCGTGDVSFALAKAGAQVIGLDFSEAMLAVAEFKVQSSKFKVFRTASPLPARNEWGEGQGEGLQPAFIRGDAQQVPFPDNSFEIVTVSYGLRNLPSWERGLEEMFRAAKPGGRLLVLDFGKPDNKIWRALYFSYLRGFVPLFGKVFCGDSQTHAYILESLRHYPAQHGVAEKMRKLNCRNVEIVNLLGGVMTINHGQKPVSE